MLNFTPLIERETTIHNLCGHLTPEDLRALTNEMIDTMLALIVDCNDSDVTFVYTDPDAYDKFAATEEDIHMPWTLGHVIVHATASAEEAAFLAAELARGVKRPGRSRYELDWKTITTVEQCRQRLEESRRMRLASLDLWPNPPHLENIVELKFLEGPVNPPSRFAAGLLHDSQHVGQVREIMRQAKADRLK